MKIKNLRISNFKAIKNIELNNLSDTVLIAGANGCGKSCIFHAIRLLKSVIGGYQDNEWQLWFQEFQMDPNRFQDDIVKLLQTEDRSLEVSADFELSDDEKNILKSDGKLMLEHQFLKQQLQGLISQDYRERPLGVRYQPLLIQASQVSNKQFEDLQKELDNHTLKAQIKTDKDHNLLIVSPPKALGLVFSYYEEHLGIIDYHGPHRNYQRERLDNINLNIQTGRQTIKDHSLYNYSNKYTNIKQEMASVYIRKLLTQESGSISNTKDSDLIETLKELFNEFFPEKEFLGPKPNNEGGIDFPVKLANGTTHDLNDLSSGEMEVLYGYLKLRCTAPKNSIILLDEPELHLNPRLIAGLPRFYKNHLGKKLGNQFFLITHSDMFLREAMKEKDYQVFHIKSSSNISSYEENQIEPIDASSSLNETLIDLVGDLATYSPDKKMVLLEGKNSEFDLKMIAKLFPEFLNHVNLIPVGSKREVHQLHELLEKTNQESQLNTKFFSIVDKDSDSQTESRSSKKFIWNVYHIENYLIDKYFLTESVKGLILEASDLKEEEVLEMLKECSKKSINNLIKHALENKVYQDTFGKINLGFDTDKANNISREIYGALTRNIEKISKIPTEKYLENLKKIENQERKSLNQSFEDSSWKSKIIGRDVLKEFVSEINKKFSQSNFSYIVLRNNTISLMAKEGHKPDGMKKIINEIVNA